METETKTIASRIGEIVGTLIVGAAGVLILSVAAFVILEAWRVMRFS